jgi:ribosomal protein S18 acetylase RimI-like enzyme
MITYRSHIKPSAAEIITLYDNAGLPRPTNNAARIQAMYDNADLVVTAWDGKELAGVSRSITDWVWCCYLADLAVSSAYKQQGIGKELVRLTKGKLGPQCMLLLLSVPDAMSYYPKIGMTPVENGFILNRSE